MYPINHLSLEQKIELKETTTHVERITQYSQIKFKTSMLKSSLCDYNDAYMSVSGTITITGAGDNDAAKEAYERDKGVIFKNCKPFTDCISKTSNT